MIRRDLFRACYTAAVGRALAAGLLTLAATTAANAQFEDAFDFGTDLGKINETASTPPEIAASYGLGGGFTTTELPDSLQYSDTALFGTNKGVGYFFENPVSLNGIDEANDVFTMDITINPGNEIDQFTTVLLSNALGQPLKRFVVTGLLDLAPGKHTVYTTQTWDNPDFETGASIGLFNTATVPVDNIQLFTSNFFNLPGQPSDKDVEIEIDSFGFFAPTPVPVGVLDFGIAPSQKGFINGGLGAVDTRGTPGVFTLTDQDQSLHLGGLSPANTLGGNGIVLNPAVDLSGIDAANDVIVLDLEIGATNELDFLFVEVLTGAPGADTAITTFQITGLSALAPGNHTVTGLSFDDAAAANPSGSLPQFDPATDDFSRISFQAWNFFDGVDVTVTDKVIDIGIDKISFGAPVGQPGDFDGDGDVDVADALRGQRDGEDLTASGDWDPNFGTGELPVSAVGAVPEPTSLAMFTVLGLALAGRRRRA